MYDIELYKTRPVAVHEQSSGIVRRQGLHWLHVFLARGIEEREPEDFRSPRRFAEVMNEDPSFGDDWEVRLVRW